MGTKAKAVFALIAVYAVVCFIVNFIHHLPLGSLGSWIFNPLGAAFADKIATSLINFLMGPLAWLVSMVAHGSAAFLVGGILALVWSLLLFIVGAIVAIKS